MGWPAWEAGRPRPEAVQMNGLAGLLAGRPRLDRVLMHASGGMDFSARLGVFKANVTGAQGLAGLLAGRPRSEAVQVNGLAGLLAGRPPPPPSPPGVGRRGRTEFGARLGVGRGGGGKGGA